MAAKNSVKIYAPDSYYHIYNRGVAKDYIFRNDKDCGVFLSYLKTYLLPKDLITLHSIFSSQTSTSREKDKASKLIALKNFHGEMELVAYALLPNHFHLLVRQNEMNTIDKFMNAFGTRYTGYFNHKYKRVGPLYQGVYKAVLVTSDEQLLHLSRYIHLNPYVYSNWRGEVKLPAPFPCSLPEYLGVRQTKWVSPKSILDYFTKTNKSDTYEKFISQSLDPEIIVPVAIDFEDE